MNRMSRLLTAAAGVVKSTMLDLLLGSEKSATPTTGGPMPIVPTGSTRASLTLESAWWCGEHLMWHVRVLVRGSALSAVRPVIITLPDLYTPDPGPVLWTDASAWITAARASILVTVRRMGLSLDEADLFSFTTQVLLTLRSQPKTTQPSRSS